LTDAELLRGAQNGNAEAWRTLYQRSLPAVWRQAYALVGDVHIAEDITSETMLALLKNIDQLETDAPRIAGWLRAVVRCKAADHQRRAFRLRDKLAVAATLTSNGAAGHAPSARLEAEEMREHVLEILDALPDRQRVVLEWKYLDALRVREIAERLGDTEKAVETVLYRARREFRRLFETQRIREVRVARTSERGADIPQELES
jgi:RNA polymerase sigma-70 factor (ECF subfamily)